jgi:hypothetical protein
VTKDNDRLLPKWRNDILDQFPLRRKRDLHFRNLKHDQKVVACRSLSAQPFGTCIVASYKPTLLDLDPQKLEIFKQKGHLYNYLVRLLLERVTEACVRKSAIHGRKCKVLVTFSKRSGTDYEVMRDYLFLMRDDREKLVPKRSINWSALNPEDVRVEDHSNRAGLQIADVATSATHNALETNIYGDTEPRYATLLRNRFLRENGRVSNCGLTIVPYSTSIPKIAKEFASNL